MSASPVLLVEPDAALSQRWEDLLSQAEVRVVTVASAGEGLREARESRFRATIMAEELLPTPQGRTLYDRCLENTSHALVVSTGCFDAGNAVELRSGGVFDYVDVRSPDRAVKELIERLDQFLEMSEEGGVRRALWREQERTAYWALRLTQLEGQREIASALVHGLMEVCGARSAAMWLDQKGMGELELTACEGEDDEAIRVRTFRLSDATGEHLLEHGLPFVADDDVAGQLIVQQPLMHEGKVLGLVKVSGLTRSSVGQGIQGQVRKLVDAAAVALGRSRNERADGRGFLTTGDIYSRAYYDDFLHRELRRARRYGRPLTIVLIAYAHRTGAEARLLPAEVSQLAQHAGSLMVSALRTIDLVAQIDDGLFAVVLPETEHLYGLVVAQRLRGGLESHEVISPLSSKHQLAFGFGVASLGGDGNEPRALMSTATRRLEEHLRASLANPMVRRLSFWGAVEVLVAPPIAGDSDEHSGQGNGAAVASSLWPSMNKRAIEAARDLALEQAQLQAAEPGWLYLVGELAGDGHRLSQLESSLKEGRLKLYTLGATISESWLGLDYLTQLVIEGDKLSAYEGVLFLTRHSAYAMVAFRQSEDSWIGYHTTDWVIVTELIDKLQKTYQLQKGLA